MIINNIFLVLFMCFCVVEVRSWDTDELEIFDLVEEINENFYTLLGISKEAPLKDVKKAFRNLSVILHPDKNSAEDANIKFRNLVSVYDVLKDTSKREKYDEVLKNGLPNWRSAVYYYRHVRKVGLLEMSIILFTLITVGQYIVGWAVYAEKRHTAEKLLGSKLKKSQKKNKTGFNINIDDLPTPSIKNTLPFQIPRIIWATITGIPWAIQTFKEILEEKKKKKLEEEQWEIEQEEMRLEAEKAKESRGPRRRKPAFKLPEMTDEDYIQVNSEQKDPGLRIHKPNPVISGGLWTDDDFSELIRLVKKYPGGTPERWEIIATAMNRSVGEVTHMSNKMKDNCYRTQQDENDTLSFLETRKTKTKTKGTIDRTSPENIDAVWSQEQQKALESALIKYPKGGVADRWEKIAHCVNGKTKEECIVRYKLLVEIVKKQKNQESEKLEEETKLHEERIEEININECPSIETNLMQNGTL